MFEKQVSLDFSEKQQKMTSIPGTDNLVWSDEQTRFYLQLRIAEKVKGNIRQQHVNDAGRQSIIDKFYEEFGQKHPWKKFGIKHTTCKKQYDSLKRLTRNRTGLGYHRDGSINMSDDWWNDLYKEWPGSRKLKDKPVPNMDLMEKVFSTCNVTGGEGWTAAQGEEHLDTMHLDQDNDVDNDVESRQIPLRTRDVDDAESVPIPPTQANTGNGPSSSNNGNRRSSSSRTNGTRKRPRGGAVAEEIRNSTESRDKLLAQKNNLIEGVVSHPEFTCSQFRAMEVLHSLPDVRVWSPLYKEAIDHLKQDPTNRQTFLFYKDDENKTLYLEYATGVYRDE